LLAHGVQDELRSVHAAHFHGMIDERLLGSRCPEIDDSACGGAHGGCSFATCLSVLACESSCASTLVHTLYIQDRYYSTVTHTVWLKVSETIHPHHFNPGCAALIRATLAPGTDASTDA